MENLGFRRSLPAGLFSEVSGLEITVPPFISLPVAANVKTEPMGSAFSIFAFRMKKFV